MNYFLTSAIIFTVWQANAEPVVPRFIEGIIQATRRKACRFARGFETYQAEK